MNASHPLVHDPSAILTVSGLSRAIKGLIENSLPELWLRGEVSNLRLQASGHAYFSLKDEHSQVSCAFFRADLSRCRVRLQDGLQILAWGRVSVYEPRGVYQFIVRHALPDGLGRLQAEFERLKQKLQAEGLFDPAKRRPLPPLPLRVAFVTSPTGAAIRDFISVLRRRGWPGHLTVVPARVQGNGAAAEIVAGLQQAASLEGVQLIVVGRGGGSLEDLWPFNEEVVARAVAASPIPVISAVGHEIDFTLSDFAADLRAETPSSAAELISSRVLKQKEWIAGARDRLNAAAAAGAREFRQRIDLLAKDLQRLSPQSRLEQAWMRTDDLRHRLLAAFQGTVERRHRRYQEMALRFRSVDPRRTMDLSRERLHHLSIRLRGASPHSVLQRGFAMVMTEDGSVVPRRQAIPPNSSLRLSFADGEVKVRPEPEVPPSPQRRRRS